MRKHHRLIAWQEAIELVTDIYEITSNFPRDELYGLTAQMRRAAISVPSNIAEGAARMGNRDFARFLVTARSSLSELDTQLTIAERLGYVSGDGSMRERMNRIFRLLAGLLKVS
jgi:four helix bundle protein